MHVLSCFHIIVRVFPTKRKINGFGVCVFSKIILLKWIIVLFVETAWLIQVL